MATTNPIGGKEPVAVSDAATEAQGNESPEAPPPETSLPPIVALGGGPKGKKPLSIFVPAKPEDVHTWIDRIYGRDWDRKIQKWNQKTQIVDWFSKHREIIADIALTALLCAIPIGAAFAGARLLYTAYRVGQLAKASAMITGGLTIIKGLN